MSLNETPNPMNALPTLICIPDISGFTKFMSETDFELSSKVIPTLLNNIIYANEIGLKVSEIEGDAVLFFRHGEPPPIKELIDQCRFFYSEFYSQLKRLRAEHAANKDAWQIPETLGLKIILHFGDQAAPTQVGSRIKLFGEDVIIAHRLLKNDVPLEEYILMSEALTDKYKDELISYHLNWAQNVESDSHYEHVGTVKYCYIGLNPLRQ